MLLNRLTFRLMSLIVLFTLAFTTTAVIAETGGPTVEITQGTSKIRAAFDLTFTFSHPVEAQGTSNQTLAFTWRLVDAQTNLLGPTATAGSATQTANSRTEYTARLDITGDTNNVNAVEVIVYVAADIKRGTTSANSKQNQPAEETFNLPPVQGDTTVAVTAEEIANQPGGYTVTFTFSANTSPAFTQANISIPTSGVALSNFQTVTAETVYSADAQLVFGASGIRVGVDPGYAGPTPGASSFVTLPPPPPIEQDPPSVSMRVSSHDPASREFRLDITFTPGLKSNGQPGDPVTVGTWLDTSGEDFLPYNHLKFTDATNANIRASLMNEGDRAADNSYVAIFKYSVLDTLPITITTVDTFETSDNPRTSVMVGAGPGTPQPPPSGITFSPNQIPNQRFVVNTPITPLTLPVATGGTSPYTYTLAPRPAGLLFNSVPAARELSGTPTTVGTTATTYTARDSGGRTATLTFTIEVVAAGTPSSIPDANLAAAIRRSLSLPANTPLTTALMAQLTNLNAYGSSVAQLNGLEQATNLTTLDLGMNRITSISTLASLTKLTHLYLDDNQITNVSPLVGLRNLRLLRLAGNPIQDTSPLATLIQQNPGLDLDIPPIPPQTGSVTFADPKLETAVRIALRMSASEVITREAMLGLVFLEAYDRRIESIQGLQHATNLIALDLGKNAIVNISPLSGLTKLQILFLDDNQIVDVSPLAGLTQLDLLFLTGNPISSLAPISHLIDGIQIIRTRADH